MEYLAHLCICICLGAPYAFVVGYVESRYNIKSEWYLPTAAAVGITSGLVILFFFDYFMGWL